MTRPAVRIVAVCLVLISLPLSLVLCSRLEVVSAEYATRDEADASGALGEGKWLPSELPHSAKLIRKTHDMDTNEVWFSYVDRTARPPPSCEARDRPQMVLPRRTSSGAVEAHVDGVSEALEDARGTAMFHCRGEEYPYSLVIDRQRGMAWGWSTRVSEADLHRAGAQPATRDGTDE